VFAQQILQPILSRSTTADESYGLLKPCLTGYVARPFYNVRARWTLLSQLKFSVILLTFRSPGHLLTSR